MPSDNGNVMKSKTVYGCSRYLNEIAERYDVNIIYVGTEKLGQ